MNDNPKIKRRVSRKDHMTAMNTPQARSGHKTTGARLFIAAAALFLLACATASAGAKPQKSFSTAEDAVAALVAAARTDDADAMISILGAGSRDLVFSGDETADASGRRKFVAAYDASHRLVPGAEHGCLILEIGADQWQMPIPLVKRGEYWAFDISRGREEILNRRVGRNELRTIEVIRAYVDAQHEYATRDCRGEGRVEFAQKLISTGSRRDGLYWVAMEGEKPSPLGPLMAQAAEEGYADLSPFHGYYFRILKSQGKHATGGAFDYVVKGRMILGFGLIAYPASYGNSGVMTFIVNQEGVVYEKDLGRNTRKLANAIRSFNPDRTWKKVEEPPQ